MPRGRRHCGVVQVLQCWHGPPTSCGFGASRCGLGEPRLPFPWLLGSPAAEVGSDAPANGESSGVRRQPLPGSRAHVMITLPSRGPTCARSKPRLLDFDSALKS